MNQNTDFIIIGQGLAGTLLAYTLLKKNKKVLILDNGKTNASKVAAGIYNPVTGRRLVKSWRVDEFLPLMNSFYTNLEEELGEKFLHPKKIIRVIQNEEEKKYWQKRQNDDDYTEYVKINTLDKEEKLPIPSPYGYFEIDGGGFLDVKKLLTRLSVFFNEKEILQEEDFDFSALHFEENRVRYKSYYADYIIFCEGYMGAKNPFFGHLPFKLNKGELLTITSDHIPEEIYVKGKFLLETPAKNFKCGATYEWDDLEIAPTDKGRKEISTFLNENLKGKYSVINHEAGIRPAVIDRRPLLGFHSENKKVAIFNGFGTKGVLLIPYFALHFAEVLCSGIDVEAEVNISRFQKK